MHHRSHFEPAACGIYWCGNSLGLLPKRTRAAVAAELDAWGARGVEAHFDHDATPWVDIDLPLIAPLATLVGAGHHEVAAMGLLTANLNALLVAFYRPAGKRTKILFEKHAFPLDYYAFLNMVKLHGLDESALVQMEVRHGETHLLTEDILDYLDKHGDEVAIVLFPGIQYYTGQFFDIEKITRAAHAKGALAGWDLAHAVGNVPLRLHDWDVDFAAWCLYKYLNAGPGGIGGIYVHERFSRENSKLDFPARLAGWWGNSAGVRFQMLEQFDPPRLALLYRQLNPSVLDCVALRALLEVFELAGGIGELRKTSLVLTGRLEALLKASPFFLAKTEDSDRLGYKILTPEDPEQRGCQLSLAFQPKDTMEKVNAFLRKNDIVCDERRPDVIRLAPVPLYNTLDEVETVVRVLTAALESLVE